MHLMLTTSLNGGFPGGSDNSLPAMQETELMIVVLISTTLTEVFPPVKRFYCLVFIDVPNCRLYS